MATIKKVENKISKRKTPREQLLEQAVRITTVDRNSSYGNPEDNFKNIADYWSSYLTQSTKLDIVISPQDVAHMMILMKVARLATNPQHYDSLLDIAGYAACGEDCRQAAADKNMRTDIGFQNAVGGVNACKQSC